MSSWLSPALPIVLALLVIPLVYFVRRSGPAYSTRTVSTRTRNSVSYQVDPKPQEWAYELMRNGKSIDCNASFPLRCLDVTSDYVRIIHDAPSKVTTFTVEPDDLLYLRRRSSRRNDLRARGRTHMSRIYIKEPDGTLGWHVNESDPNIEGGIYLGENPDGNAICIIAGKNVHLHKE